MKNEWDDLLEMVAEVIPLDRLDPAMIAAITKLSRTEIGEITERTRDYSLAAIARRFPARPTREDDEETTAEEELSDAA